MENLNKSAPDCRGGTQRVKMGGIPSLERFQAQAIWEMSVNRFNGQRRPVLHVISLLLQSQIQWTPGQFLTKIGLYPQLGWGVSFPLEDSRTHKPSVRCHVFELASL